MGEFKRGGQVRNGMQYPPSKGSKQSRVPYIELFTTPSSGMSYSPFCGGGKEEKPPSLGSLLLPFAALTEVELALLKAWRTFSWGKRRSDPRNLEFFRCSFSL